MKDVRSVVADHWAALDAAAPSTTWLTSALPVEIGGSPVLCAVGPERRRHLLIPVPDGAPVPVDARAAAVRLAPLILQAGVVGTTYANLELLRSDLGDIFTGLCADVVAALAADSGEPVSVAQQVLDGWHELFRSGRRLGVEQIAGLFGELLLLNELLDRDVALIGIWQGPMRAPHDFSANGHAVEVKTTVASEGRSVRIHGLEQLAAPPDGDLMVRWMRLDTADAAGTTLPELVDSTVARIGRPREFWQLLARSGYMTADRSQYDGLRFTLVEEAGYRVTEDFPRIVPASFLGGTPVGVSHLRYTLDLDLVPAPMQKDEIIEFLDRMAKR